MKIFLIFSVVSYLFLSERKRNLLIQQLYNQQVIGDLLYNKKQQKETTAKIMRNTWKKNERLGVRELGRGENMLKRHKEQTGD